MLRDLTFTSTTTTINMIDKKHLKLGLQRYRANQPAVELDAERCAQSSNYRQVLIHIFIISRINLRILISGVIMRILIIEIILRILISGIILRIFISGIIKRILIIQIFMRIVIIWILWILIIGIIMRIFNTQKMQINLVIKQRQETNKNTQSIKKISSSSEFCCVASSCEIGFQIKAVCWMRLKMK